jgi:hypothetical protein
MIQYLSHNITTHKQNAKYQSKADFIQRKIGVFSINLSPKTCIKQYALKCIYVDSHLYRTPNAHAPQYIIVSVLPLSAISFNNCCIKGKYSDRR